ncbi:type I methionyl aminopeptidase [Candidatus Nomurabacteria bacterium]|nr:type I methionyl aminopeptidase [Candidatus Nomurabacteria bacterium]USN94792.1 MAG: type I methionyl aminopeptidase [Candidatus Nomurabacteria bacterium]
MTISIKTKEEIELLREGGKRLGTILKKVGESVRPGIRTSELEAIAISEIEKLGDKPAFKGYTPEGASYPYPTALCVSINEEIVHGIPSEDRILEEGDIVTIDLGLNHSGMFTDHAVTLPVGKVSSEKIDLLRKTKECLDSAIMEVKPGAHIGDIGAAVEECIKGTSYKIVKDLAGHGVGYSVHEDPYVPNEGKRGTGPELTPGMVIAIEPMLSLGSPQISLLEDDYTLSTQDGSLSAHFEHTVVVTDDGVEVLTEV